MGSEVYLMNENELRQLAIETVIKYAEEQGVKIRRLDFGESATHTRVFVLPDVTTGMPATVVVRISYNGRWSRQMKDAKENFLNYINARLETDWLSFSFSVNELKIIADKKRTSEAPDEKMERVIERINKLLALADQSRNNSEQEAIAASLQVQKLLAKYNLSLTDVTGERPEEDVEQSIADVGKGKLWKCSLADTVALNFACKCYFVGNSKEQVVFFGYKADVIAARRTFIYLFKVGNKLANQTAKNYREKYGYADGIYNSFCSGFVSGIKKELDKQCKALAIVVQPKVQESWDAFSEGFGRFNSNISVNNIEAYKKGQIEGKRALNAQYIEE